MITAFIDESGDEFLTEASRELGPWFVNATAIFEDGNGRSPGAIMCEAKARIKQKGQGVIKFRKLVDRSREKFASAIAEGDPLLSVVLVHKDSVETYGSFEKPELMHNWTLKLLLERISWRAQYRRMKAHVVIAEKGQTRESLKRYLDALKSGDGEGIQFYNHSIRWDWLNGAPEFEKEENSEGLRIADAAATSFGVSLNPVTGGPNPLYVGILRQCLHSVKGNYASYGVKIHPSQSKFPDVLKDMPGELRDWFSL